MGTYLNLRRARGGLFLTLLLVGTTVQAAVSHLVRYQGQAVDSQGVPLQGPYALTFRLYDADAGGTVVWQEVQANVPINKGHFSVLLGQVTSLTVDWSQSLWLSIQVGTDPELLPRQRITSVPLAIRAEVAEGLTSAITPLLINPQGSGSGLDADLLDGLHATAFSQLGTSIETTEITDGTIGDADVAASAAIAGTKISPNFGSQTIVTTGNVGIGTTSPSQQLHVAGNTQMDGTIRGATYGFGGAFIHSGWTGSSCLQANPFTGGCSCPSGFSPVYLDVTEGRALGICVR